MCVHACVHVHVCVRECMRVCVCWGAWSACGVEGCGQHVLPRGVVSMWC